MKVVQLYHSSVHCFIKCSIKGNMYIYMYMYKQCNFSPTHPNKSFTEMFRL